jgi:hypothetical protein
MHRAWVWSGMLVVVAAVATFSQGDANGGNGMPLRDQFESDIGRFLQDLDQTDVPKKAQLEQDAHNLELLLALADKHHDALGAQCLVYYLTGLGEEYSVSDVEGSREVDDFLKPYLDQLDK